jgi:hypothetical protein
VVSALRSVVVWRLGGFLFLFLFGTTGAGMCSFSITGTRGARRFGEERRGMWGRCSPAAFHDLTGSSIRDEE